MKKIIALVAALSLSVNLFACEDNKSNFDSEYNNGFVSVGIMNDWEQTQDSSSLTTMCWNKDDDFKIMLSTSAYADDKTSEDIIKDFKEYDFGSDETTYESKKIADFDCVIISDCELYDGEYNNEIIVISKSCRSYFYFTDSAKDTVFSMIESLKFNFLTEDEYTVLDSDFETDFIKFGVSSNWVKSYESLSESSQYVDFDWMSNDDVYSINCVFYTDEFYKKETTFELEESWVSLQEFYKDESPDLYDDTLKIVDSFVENGIACIVISSEEEETRTIKFSNDGIKGSFEYTENCEEIIKEMINTIEFY